MPPAPTCSRIHRITSRPGPPIAAAGTNHRLAPSSRSSISTDPAAEPAPSAIARAPGPMATAVAPGGDTPSVAPLVAPPVDAPVAPPPVDDPPAVDDPLSLPPPVGPPPSAPGAIGPLDEPDDGALEGVGDDEVDPGLGLSGNVGNGEMGDNVGIGKVNGLVGIGRSEPDDMARGVGARVGCGVGGGVAVGRAVGEGVGAGVGVAAAPETTIGSSARPSSDEPLQSCCRYAFALQA